MAERANPYLRRMSDREMTQLQETGKCNTLGGFTLASLIASLNDLGLGPEDVEISGNGQNYGVELFVVDGPEEQTIPDA